MKQIKFFLLCILCLFILCSCEDDNNNNTIFPTENSIDLFAMDTYMRIKVYGEDTDNVLNSVKSEIITLDNLFNVNNAESDIYNINSHCGDKIKVNVDTINLINKSIEISKETNGALDISIYPIVKEWGFTTGEYKIPDDNTINQLLQYVDFNKIKVEGDRVCIPKNSAIDLGSVAKGYTGDKISSILKENGIKSALIDLGGNIQTIGVKPNGDLWSVAVKNPTDTENYICILKVSDKAVITSGNYERYFTDENGKRYCHIMDTSTGRPAENGLISVTVIGDSGVKCDALSTSLYVMGTEKAVEYCNAHKDIDAIFVTEDMKIMITENIKNSIQMLNGYIYEVI